MRKLVSIGLLAVFIGGISTAALAGNVPQCEVLKDGHTPGLYGLCVAWANAGNEKARERIYENYANLRGDADPTLEELFEEGVVAECPCFDALDLSTAMTRPGATRVECGAIDNVDVNGNPDGSSYDFLTVHDDEVAGETPIERFAAGELFPEFYFCENANAELPLNLLYDLSAETTDACIELMNAARLVLADEGIDCTEIPEAP